MDKRCDIYICVFPDFPDFPDGSVVKNPPAMRKYGFNSWSGRPPGEAKGNPLQYYCLGDIMDSRAWQAILHGVTKESDMT